MLLIIGAETVELTGLREIGDEAGIPSSFIADGGEMQLGMVNDEHTVSITAGASAPEVLVEDVIDALRRLGPVEVSELTGRQETVEFDLGAGRGGGVICHHAVNRRFAVAAVLGAVGGVDARAKVGPVIADIFDSGIGLQARDSDARSSRVHRVTEPAVVTSVPGPHVDLSADADNPYRNLSAQCPIGALGRDPKLFGAIDSLPAHPETKERS